MQTLPALLPERGALHLRDDPQFLLPTGCSSYSSPFMLYTVRQPIHGLLRHPRQIMGFGKQVAFQQSRQLGVEPFLRFRQITGDAGGDDRQQPGSTRLWGTRR